MYRNIWNPIHLRNTEPKSLFVYPVKQLLQTSPWNIESRPNQIVLNVYCAAVKLPRDEMSSKPTH